MNVVGVGKNGEKIHPIHQQNIKEGGRMKLKDIKITVNNQLPPNSFMMIGANGTVATWHNGVIRGLKFQRIHNC